MKPGKRLDSLIFRMGTLYAEKYETPGLKQRQVRVRCCGRGSDCAWQWHTPYGGIKTWRYYRLLDSRALKETCALLKRSVRRPSFMTKTWRLSWQNALRSRRYPPVQPS